MLDSLTKSSSINQEKQICNQSSQYEKYWMKPKEMITKLTMFVVSKYEWYTKDDRKMHYTYSGMRKVPQGLK